MAHLCWGGGQISSCSCCAHVELCTECAAQHRVLHPHGQRHGNASIENELCFKMFQTAGCFAAVGSMPIYLPEFAGTDISAGISAEFARTHPSWLLERTCKKYTWPLEPQKLAPPPPGLRAWAGTHAWPAGRSCAAVGDRQVRGRPFQALGLALTTTMFQHSCIQSHVKPNRCLLE
jgi:hypothetical protein